MSEATPDTGNQPNGTGRLESAKDTVFSSASSAMDTVQNHPATQNITNGPVGDKVREEHAKTATEFQDLANSRTTPEQPAATGQPLTHYHSMFYRLLSWKNPRATGLSFASAVIFIFLSRYLPILRYIFKAVYTVLGITAAAEIGGKAVFGNGFTSQMRPRKYFTIPKDSLERFMDDFEQLVNFFVIEFQRIVFAENVYVTVGAFFSAFISYYLVKWLPLWGLTLLATSVIYLAPLIYIKNKDLIDAQLNQASDIVSKQASQVREMTGQYTGRAGEQMRVYATQAQERAQGLMGHAKKQTGYGQPPQEGDFPRAPANEPAPAPAPVKEESAPPKVDEKIDEPIAAMRQEIQDNVDGVNAEGIYSPGEISRWQTAMETAVVVLTDKDDEKSVSDIDMEDAIKAIKQVDVHENDVDSALESDPEPEGMTRATSDFGQTEEMGTKAADDDNDRSSRPNTATF